jgi:KRAB domain-containing zinc finger protein
MLSVTISQIFINLLSASGKLLTPKLESIDSEYDGNSTAAESQSDDLPQTVGSFINPLSDETDLTNLMGSPKSVTVEAVGNHSFTSSSPGSQARPILARLLSPNIQNQSTFSRIQPPTNRNASSFPRFQTPTNQNISSFPGFQSSSNPNLNLLSRLLSPANQVPSSMSTFQSPVSPLVTNDMNQLTNNNFTQIQPAVSSNRRGRKRKNVMRVVSPVDAETDDTENESSSQKTVTLRSGRKVKVPSWRKSVLEDALKTIRHKSADDFCDVQIKQERISPTFEDDEDGVHVEFDFDILAELKKESDTDQDQSDASSWCGTVQITSSADDSTPSKVPFKFNFKDKNQSVKTDTASANSDLSMNSIGLVRKPSKIKETGKNTIDDKFDYHSMFNIMTIEGTRQYRCNSCLHLLKANECLKDHCFNHEWFTAENPVCHACDKIFGSKDELLEHSKEHSNLYSCLICKEPFASKLCLIQHLNWIHKEMFSCPKCDNAFTSSKALSHHMEMCFDPKALETRAGIKLMTEKWVVFSEDGNIAYKCRSCKDCFETVEEYNKHMLQHRSKFVLDVNEKMEKVMLGANSSMIPKTNTAKRCDKCNKCFESAWHLTKHKRLKHGKDDDGDTPVSFKCSSCDIHFDAEVDFSSHCMIYHPSKASIESNNKDEFPCDKCSKRTQTKEGFELHQKIHENVVTKQCDDCGSYLYTEASMQLHSCIRDESEFLCDECGICFLSQMLLSQHMNHVHGRIFADIKSQMENMKNGRVNICNVCGRAFKKASDLAAHRSVHTGELPFVCHLCYKKFRLRSTLKSHLMTHRDYHEFICEVCGRTFKLMESLRLHRRLHSKSCYFKCKHCPKEFRAYDGLKYHMLRAHREMVAGNNLKIYKCEYCEKDMATHQQYVRHVSIHTNDKPLKCNLCETRWATISQLNAHKKKHDADHLKYSCDVCQKRFPIRSKLHRHMKTAKHIENCKVKNLPVDTIQLAMTLSSETVAQPADETNHTADERQNLEDKVEIMFYEINLPNEENVDDSSSLMYDIEVAPENQVDETTYNETNINTTETVDTILNLENQSD